MPSEDWATCAVTTYGQVDFRKAIASVPFLSALEPADVLELVSWMRGRKFLTDNAVIPSDLATKRLSAFLLNPLSAASTTALSTLVRHLQIVFGLCVVHHIWCLGMVLSR